MGSGGQRAVSGTPGGGRGEHHTPTRRAGGTSQIVREESPIEGGKDGHEDDNGSDRHRDKRQKRNDDADASTGSVPRSSSGPGTIDQRVHLELHGERTEHWVGPPIHNPGLYERIQRDGRAGVYVGPGAGVVARYTPLRQPQRETDQGHDHAAGSTLAPGGKRRAGDGVAETVTSVTGTSSDADELPQVRTTKKRPQVEDSSGESTVGAGETAKVDKGKDRAVEENNIADPADPSRQSNAGPESAEQVVISSDQSHRTVYERYGERTKERPPPYKSSHFTPSPGEIRENPPHIPYSGFYEKRLIKKLKREFGRMGRNRLMLHFPIPRHPTRRIRTWSAPNIAQLGSFGRTLASVLPTCPQLTRPGRRVNLIFDKNTPVIKEESPPEEIDLRQFPLPSIEDAPESEAGPSTRNEARGLDPEDESGQLLVEAESEVVVEEPPRRTRRQAAIAGREKIRESTAPPRRAATRGPAARKTVATPSAEQQPEIKEQVQVEIPAVIPEEAEQAETSTRPKQASRARAKGKAPSKAPAETKAAKVTKVTKAAKATKVETKKSGPKLKTQATSKVAPKSKVASKATKGGAGKKGK
ncbi:hypothetical protein MGYG_00603 [Nannizzia gypsea CBS 118893]|uniref:Uncharacterized protein n=1 Tax=Arthroderma gypseum (strain ATCC MYA-4604 / CBS 118893) TaxID=535722 RepID=E5R0Q6_ARTGP|nr:hypothetical protein MGYG_00603 [Nannizzia gypsea CBS 118893]EFQ97562.1 hypothetical protein MGYG_00603 [Nannizzia gypsea CBS 118893]